MDSSLFNLNTNQEYVGYNIDDGSNYAEYKSIENHSTGEHGSIHDDNTNDLPINDNSSQVTSNNSIKSFGSLKDIESHIDSPLDKAVRDYNECKHKFVDILAQKGYAEPYKIIEEYEREGFSNVLSPIIKPIKKKFNKNASNDTILQRTRQTIKYVQQCQVKYWIINAIIRLVTIIIIVCISYYFLFKRNNTPTTSQNQIPLVSSELPNS